MKVKKKKNLYIQPLFFLTAWPKKKKAITIASNVSHITLRKVPVERSFVSRKIYENRNFNFLRRTQFTAEWDTRLNIGYAIDESSIYEFELKNVKKRNSRHNFIKPNYRISNKGVELDYFLLFVKMRQGNIKM